MTEMTWPEMMWHCPDCGPDTLFEQLHDAGNCPDSPDGECPEWACTGCGAALLAGLASWPGDAAREPARRVA